MARQRIQRLVARAKLRVRLQRLAEAVCTAAMPILVLVAIAVFLGKRQYLQPDELASAVVALGAVLAVVGIAALLWPIPTLETLIRLDRANAFSDRLSSAYAFLQRAEGERTPEMTLHVERTLARLDEVRVAPAAPFRRPRHLVPAVVLGGVLAFVSVLEEPAEAVLPPASATIPPPRLIVDLAALRPEMRQLEALEELAERSDDRELQSAYDELASLMDRLERGRIGEEELLDRLDGIDRRLERVEYEEPIDMQADWADIAQELRAVAEEQGLAEEVEDVLAALESGDEQPLAQALEALTELLESEELSGEDSAALADAIEQLADAVEAGDDELREQIEAYREQIEELQQQLEERDSRRDRRALERLLERLAEAEEELLEQLADMGRNGALREAIAQALQDAAEALREPRSSGEQSETGTAPYTPPGEGEGEGEEQAGTQTEGERDDGDETGPEQDTADRAEGDDREGAEQTAREETRDPSEASEQRTGEQTAGREGQEDREGQGDREGQEGPSQAEGPPPSDEGTTGEEQASTGEPQAGEERAGQRQTQGQQPSAPNPQQQRASDALTEVAEQIRDVDRNAAREEGVDRAQTLSERLRENLQRSSQEPIEQDAVAEQTWDDFMDRAAGQEPSEPGSGSEQRGGTDEGAEPSDGEGSESGEGRIESSWGTEEGGDAMGEESTELDSSRERVSVEGNAAEGGGSTSEVIEAASASGFASRGYREVYQEYAEAAEAALEAEEVPVGFASFIRNYFDLIEPR